MLKILVQRADRLGDVLFSLPIIERLNQKFPHAEIHFLTSKIGADFLDGHPLIKKIIVYEDFRKTLAKIRKENYSTYISLWNHPSMANLGLLAGIPTRVGDSSNPSLSWMYTMTVDQNWEDYTRHQIEFNLDLLAPLGIRGNDLNAEIHTDPAIDKKIKKYVNPRRKTIVLFTATGGTNYPIPETAILKFLSILPDEYDCILAGPDSSLAQYQSERVINLIGKTTLKELTSVIKLADFYVGPDTGPTHIASFLNKPVLFFSPIKPNPPSRWGPICSRFQIIRQEYNCAHSFGERCEPDLCFSYLTGELLYHRFLELVASKEMSPERRKRARLLNSLRVLYVTRTEREAEKALPTIDDLGKKGLIIFPIILEGGSIFDLIRLLKMIGRRNINVVQGRVPLWMIWWIRFYIGAIKKFIKPVFLRQTFHNHIRLDEYLELYESKWQKK